MTNTNEPESELIESGEGEDQEDVGGAAPEEYKIEIVDLGEKAGVAVIIQVEDEEASEPAAEAEVPLAEEETAEAHVAYEPVAEDAGLMEAWEDPDKPWIRR